jgi:LysR substrate binding domain
VSGRNICESFESVYGGSVFACFLESHGFSTLWPQLSGSRLTCRSLILAKKIPVRLSVFLARESEHDFVYVDISRLADGEHHRTAEAIGRNRALISLVDLLRDIRLDRTPGQFRGNRARLTTTGHAADLILWPKLTKFLRRYPDIKGEVIIDYSPIDIVAQRFDAGVRPGEQVAKDMIAVRIGPDLRMAAVGAPWYFVTRSPLDRPQELIGHNCINLRLPTYGGLYAWEFAKGKR